MGNLLEVALVWLEVRVALVNLVIDHHNLPIAASESELFHFWVWIDGDSKHSTLQLLNLHLQLVVSRRVAVVLENADVVFAGAASENEIAVVGEFGREHVAGVVFFGRGVEVPAVDQLLLGEAEHLHLGLVAH